MGRHPPRSRGKDQAGEQWAYNAHHESARTDPIYHLITMKDVVVILQKSALFAISREGNRINVIPKGKLISSSESREEKKMQILLHLFHLSCDHD